MTKFREHRGNNINRDVTLQDQRDEATDEAKSNTVTAPDDVAISETPKEQEVRLAEKAQENHDAVVPDSAVIADETVGNMEKAPAFINLLNKNRFPVTVNSVDGDSVQLPPGKHMVPGHFNWNLPEGVTIAKD